MAIQAFTADPAALLTKLTKAAGPHGDAETWKLDEKGNFFHSPDQWAKAGTFKASANETCVDFRWNGDGTEKKTHAFEYLHGRLVEMLMIQGGSAVTRLSMFDARKKS